MTVDSRYPELDWFLQSWRRKLNLRYLTGEALVAWSVAAPVAAVPVWSTLGSGALGLPVWFGVTLAASGLFAALQTRRRLSRAQAASWLDQWYHTQGLFRAATECLDQETLDTPRLRVLADADLRRQEIQGEAKPKLPTRRLRARGMLAAALGLASLLFLVLVDAPRGFSTTGLVADAPRDPGPGLADPEEATGSRQVSPHEAARRLYPEDARMAALAEQALASGDPGALDALLGQNSEAQTQAGARGSPPPRGGTSPGSRPPGSNPGEGAQPGTEGGGEPGSAPSQQPGSPGSQDQAGRSPGKAEATPGNQGGDAPSPPSGKSGSRQGPMGENPDMPPGPGLSPGTGSSRRPLGAPESPNPSQRQIPLKEQANPQLFEYVLPGAGPRLPSADTLADSRRSAEAVITRTSPPREFENTIRDYFLSLSQEVTP